MKDLVERYALQSKCRSRKVGAVLMDKHGSIFGQGWNGAPKGSSCQTCKRCDENEVLVIPRKSGEGLELAICSHAEANAISASARSGRSCLDATLACNTKPCGECAKLIVGAGIVEVFYLNDYPSKITDDIFYNANVKVEKLC